MIVCRSTHEFLEFQAAYEKSNREDYNLEKMEKLKLLINSKITLYKKLLRFRSSKCVF